MAAVLERLRRLLALAESPNEHEARNAAWLAVRLIRDHGVVCTLPASPPPRRPSSGARKRTPRSAPVRRVADAPSLIVSPLGGDCIECGGRYRAGASIYWLASGAGIHARCLAAWEARRR